jgi:VanZ family protein
VPRFVSPREKRFWVAAGLTLLVICASIYPARVIVDFLRSRNLLRLTVGAVFLAAGVSLLVFLMRSRPRWREIMMLIVAGLVYAGVLAVMQQPEERLHFLEYGALAGFLEAALRERWQVGTGGARTAAAAAGLAAGATALLGWLDEGIQLFVPVRVYDWRDVGFNAAAGALLIAFANLRRWARARDLSALPPRPARPVSLAAGRTQRQPPHPPGG